MLPRVTPTITLPASIGITKFISHIKIPVRIIPTSLDENTLKMSSAAEPRIAGSAAASEGVNVMSKYMIGIADKA